MNDNFTYDRVNEENELYHGIDAILPYCLKKIRAISDSCVSRGVRERAVRGDIFRRSSDLLHFIVQLIYSFHLLSLPFWTLRGSYTDWPPQCPCRSAIIAHQSLKIYLSLSFYLPFLIISRFLSHFNTYSLCSLSQNSPYLVTSRQILSFSFSFYSPIRSLLFVCRARLDKSAPLCHDSILERTKRHQILVSLVSLRYFDATSQDIRVSITVYILRWLPLTLSLTFHIIYNYMSSYLLLYTCVHLHVQASILFLASSVPFILFYNLTV